MTKREVLDFSEELGKVGEAKTSKELLLALRAVVKKASDESMRFFPVEPDDQKGPSLREIRGKALTQTAILAWAHCIYLPEDVEKARAWADEMVLGPLYDWADRSGVRLKTIRGS